MVNVIISGCNGHMGRVVEGICKSTPDVQVVAGFDVLGSTDRDFPVFSSPTLFDGKADVVIDFSSPAALDGLLNFAKSTGTALVLATTGYSPAQIATALKGVDPNASTEEMIRYALRAMVMRN